MATIAVYSLKGGVGKTTMSVNLAWAAATLSSRRTLLWDLDPQGAAGFYFQIDGAVKNGAKKLLSSEIDLEAAVQPSGYENLDIIPSDLSARNAEVVLKMGGGRWRKVECVRSISTECVTHAQCTLHFQLSSRSRTPLLAPCSLSL